MSEKTAALSQSLHSNRIDESVGGNRWRIDGEEKVFQSKIRR